MPLDPHAKRLLEMLNAGGVVDVSRLAPHDMRADFERLARMVAVHGVAVAAAEDRDLPGPGGPIPVRVYAPKDSGAATLPGLIYFHGGGGVFGSIESHDNFCRMLANASACRVVSVGYRLAPEHKFPAAVEDAYAATCRIAEHAGDFRIDPRRLAVGGDSIGGALATVVCRMARGGGPAVALQVLLCPALDMSKESDTRTAFATGYFLTQATIAWTLKHYCAPDTDLADSRISPLLAEDLSGLPPAQVHTAEFDPLRSEGDAYAARLRRAGVHVRHTCHAGMIHHFYAMGGVIPYARTAVAAAGAAIRSALG